MDLLTFLLAKHGTTAEEAMAPNRHLKRSQAALAGLVLAATAGCGTLPVKSPYDLLNGSAIDRERTAPILKIADQSLARGEWATAAGLYRRAHELAPEQVEPLIRLGSTLSRNGASAEAAEAYRMALRIDPKNTEAMRGLGLALMQRKRLDLAVEQFNAALALEEDVRVYNALGVAHDINGDHLAAQTYYYVGLDVDPSNLSIRTNLGLSLALSGDYDRSIGLLDEVARSPHATPANRQTLALAYGLSGDDEMAAQTNRIDLDEASVARNLRYYAELRARRQEGGN